MNSPRLQLMNASECIPQPFGMNLGGLAGFNAGRVHPSCRGTLNRGGHCISVWRTPVVGSVAVMTMLASLIAVAGVDFGVFDALVIIAAILFIVELFLTPGVTRGKVVQSVAFALFAIAFIFLTP